MSKKNIFIIISCFILIILVYLIYSFSHTDKKAETHAEHADHELDDHSSHEKHEIEDKIKTTISDSAAKDIGIMTDKAKEQEIKSNIPLYGRVTLNQNKIAKVGARFAGIIKEVKFNLGDKVTKGATLAIIEANDSLRKYNVTAPIEGVILSRDTNIGDVSSTEPLFVISDLSKVWAKFHVFSKDYNKVKKGQLVNIKDINGDSVYEGKVDMIFPTADELSQTYIVIIEMSNSKGYWKPGMTIEGLVDISNKKVPVGIKKSALQRIHDEYVVFIKSGNSYIAKPVKTGIEDKKFVEILAGISAGDEYVSDGSFVIKSDILKSEASHEH